MPDPILVPSPNGPIVVGDIPIITAAPKSVDLRATIESMQLTPRSQGGRGTCSIFASAFLIEYMISKERGLIGLDLSEEYLNAAANLAIGAAKQTSGDGDFFHGAAAGYEQFGIVDEVWLPYRAAFDPELQPDAELQVIGKAARFLSPFVEESPKTDLMGLSDAQLVRIREQLDQGVPVATGFHGSSSVTMQDFPGGVKAMNDETDPDAGAFAHSVALVGYVAGALLPGGGGYFVYRNSGGPDWGDKGYGYYTFDFARKFVHDFVVYRRKLDLAKLVIREPRQRPKLRFSNPQDLEVLGRKINRRSRFR
jgi:Papain family cysteine protease